jgi:hypothetical protein
MSGILDPKSRVLDSVVTLEGRRQMSSGRFKIEFVTFSDSTTFYERDAISGSSDIGSRVYLECAQLPQDQITFEADDGGKLVPIANTSGLTVAGGRILSGSADGFVILSGSAFASQAESLLASSLDNFKNLLSIGTLDTVFEDDHFELSHGEIRFRVTNDVPISDTSAQVANVSQLESFFSDERLSNIPNFKFLPPINRVADQNLSPIDPVVRKQYSLGEFQTLGANNDLTPEELDASINAARKKGNSVVVRFDPTNNANRLAGQFFEMRDGELRKLDVLEFGRFKVNDEEFPDRHVFFAGKVYEDDFGAHTFVRLFTLVFR